MKTQSRSQWILDFSKGCQSQEAGLCAFTLMEVVISASLMALILASGYVCLNAALSSQKLLEPRLEAVQNARVALGLMAADLRSACPLSQDIDLIGMHRTLDDMEADNLDFGTHNFTPHRPNEGDFCQVSFFVEKDPESGQVILWRRRNPRRALDPFSGGNREELARGVRGLRFEYYDGFDWYDTWGDVEGRAKAQSSRKERFNLYGLPEAVRITLWLDPKPRPKKEEAQPGPTPEPPLEFQTVARLNLAAKARRTATGGNSQESNQSTTTPTKESSSP
jgi:hypothetical protein